MAIPERSPERSPERAPARNGVLLARWFRHASDACLQAVHDLYRDRELPGYVLLPWWIRCRINVQALGAFLCSRRFARLLLWLTVWQLASYVLIWTLDLRGPAAAVPPLLALVWVMPSVASARRREVARALRYRWPA